MELWTGLSTAVIEGKVGDIEQLTRSALDEGHKAVEIIDEGLMVGMNYVAAKFKTGEMFIPEVLIAARAMQAAMTILGPQIEATDTPMAGKVLIGTVKGDVHSIGKNMVAMLLGGAGFEVRDLGIDVAPEVFVKAIQEESPDIVGMSALLTTTMVRLKETIESFVDAGIRDNVKVVVGGSPVTADFAEEIGADGYAPNAGAAVDLAKSLIVTR